MMQRFHFPYATADYTSIIAAVLSIALQLCSYNFYACSKRIVLFKKRYVTQKNHFHSYLAGPRTYGATGSNLTC